MNAGHPRAPVAFRDPPHALPLFLRVHSQPFRAAPAGLKGPEGSERAYLQSRTVDLGLDSKIGKRRLVTEATPVSQVGGFFCDVCQCTLRDSATYLDHINGKNHQRRLGFTLRIERSTADSVRDRLANLRRAGGGGAAAAAPRGGTGKPVLDPEDRYAMAAMDNPSIQVVGGQRYATLAAAAGDDDGGGEDAGREHGTGHADDDGDGAAPPSKRARGGVDGGGVDASGVGDAGGGIDDDADAMLAMGFGSFGSTKKSR